MEAASRCEFDDSRPHFSNLIIGTRTTKGSWKFTLSTRRSKSFQLGSRFAVSPSFTHPSHFPSPLFPISLNPLRMEALSNYNEISFREGNSIIRSAVERSAWTNFHKSVARVEKLPFIQRFLRILWPSSLSLFIRQVNYEDSKGYPLPSTRPELLFRR